MRSSKFGFRAWLWGSGVRVQGLGFRVRGSGLREGYWASIETLTKETTMKPGTLKAMHTGNPQT